MTGPLRPGDRYGAYEVLELLGQGSFAHVYRVRGSGLPDAALKLSHGPLGSGEAATRSLREVAALLLLTSNHVVRIHDSGRGADGRVFIVMEHLAGSQLDVAFDIDRPMPVGQALSIIHQACLGLAEAHAHGVVHRDIKPENLWIEPGGNVKVIDFGLARAWDVSSTLGANATLGRILVGTPRYMQPEQVQTQKLTPASDVYSLATLLYELLTGRSVFFPDQTLGEIREQLRDSPVPWIEAHVRRAPVRLDHHAVGQSLPPAVVSLVDACLAKDPLQRPQTAGVLSIALGEILHYDYGLLAGATLRLTHPYGGHEERLLLPGSHRIGSDPSCEIVLPNTNARAVHAILDWDGLPSYPQLRPLVGDGSVVIDRKPVLGRTELGRDAALVIAGFGLQLLYPEAATG